MWLFVVGAIITLLVSIPITLALYTLLLAFLTPKYEHYKTALYVGNVRHTRLNPVVHTFSYPLFMFAVDLDETEELWGNSDDATKGRLWPLSTIMQFRTCDHYKPYNNDKNNNDSLQEQTCALVNQRTKELTVSPSTHRVVLVTHLSYYGYCFNPVSFYYIIDRTTHQTQAIVLEVSNTPWNEMHVYVLHSTSVDVKHSTVEQQQSKQRFVFEKTFHVSPFMEMTYDYDWTFADWNDDSMDIHASMIRPDSGVQFAASVNMTKQPSTPVRLAWQLVKFPIYCALIQVWIHYEAARLFYKGVAYQPHPEGSETIASRVIASIMTPFFALKAKWKSE